MDANLSRKIALVSICLGFCVFAQAQVQGPEPGLRSQLRENSLTEPRLPREQAESHLPQHRLPAEPPPSFALKWGTSGTGDGEFDRPLGVAVDSSGNVYVVDSLNDRIQKFDSSGTFITEWGSFGTGDGQFSSPGGVAVDASGNVYVTDANNDRIQKFDSSGTFITKWGTPGAGDGEFDFPSGLSIDVAGNVYVADGSNDRIQKFDSSGTFITKWGSAGTAEGQLDSPEGVAVDVAGNVYVADRSNNRIQKFDSGGTFQLMWGWGVDDGTSELQTCTSGCQAGSGGAGDGQLQDPYGVAVDSSGNVYVAGNTNDRTQKFDGSGILSAKWGMAGTGDGQFENPLGVAVDASGNIYVTDTLNHRVQKFSSPTPPLAFLTKWGTTGTGYGELDGPVGVAVDASGNVYVTDYWNDRIQKFDSSGTFLGTWGSSGTGDGEFDYPVGVAVDASGKVFVVEQGNDRIQVFDPDGNFVQKWGVSGSLEGQFLSPIGVAVDGLGNVYVADTSANRIQKFDNSGTFLMTWGWGVDDGTSELQQCTSGCQIGVAGSGDGQLAAARGVAIDASGNVYVADSSNNRIQKFDSSGEFITKWGTLGTGDGEFNYPLPLAIDASGDIYVTEVNNHRIQKFDGSGTFITKWGSRGHGDGQFFGPRGVAIDGAGNVYVANFGNDRIQKFGPCTANTVPGIEVFAFGGGTTSLAVDVPGASCGWAAASAETWITVDSGQIGLGDGLVGYSVGSNPTALPRHGAIEVTDLSTGVPKHTFYILQDPAPCAYGLSSSSASFSGGAGADFVNVSTLLGCPWTAVSNDGWISVDAGAAGNGDGVVLYSVAVNPGSAARSGTMTIAGQAFTVNQDPQVPDAPSNLAAAAMNSTKVSLTWTDNAGNEAWIRVERKLGAAGTFAQIVALPPDTTGFLDSGLERHTEYVYRVKACNSAGCSSPSNEATDTTPAFGTFIGDEQRGQR